MLGRIFGILIVLVLGLGLYYHFFVIGGVASVDERTTEEIVKKAPAWWASLPGYNDVPRAVYPYVYLPGEDFDEFVLNEPIEVVAIVEHGKEHLRAQEEYLHPLAYGLMYVASKKFRLGEELRAMNVEMVYRRDNGLDYDVLRKAVQFSGSLYGNLLDFDDAYGVVYTLWNDAEADMSAIDDNYDVEFPLP